MRPKAAPEIVPPQATFVEREPVEVFRYPADMTGAGPKPAFDVLLSTLPNVRDRGIYGTFMPREGRAEYFACAQRLPSDPPRYHDLTTGAIAGGLYVRRIYLTDWRPMIPHIPENFHRLVDEFHYDATRPSIEYYRGDRELHLLLPVLDRKDRAPPP
jgi:hypothetical protein